MSQFEIKNDGSFLDQFLKLQGDPKSGSEAAAGDGQSQQAGGAEQAAGENAEATGAEDPNLQYQNWGYDPNYYQQYQQYYSAYSQQYSDPSYAGYGQGSYSGTGASSYGPSGGGGGGGGRGPRNQSQTPTRSIWIGNVASDATEFDLRSKFAGFGLIENIKLLPQKNCAFINYMDVNSAITAFNSTGIMIHGVEVRIGWGKPDIGEPAKERDGEVAPSRILWIGNLSPEVDDERIRSEFSVYGHVESVRGLPHKNCAFITLGSVDEAKTARNYLQNKIIGDRPIRINFGRDEPPRGDRGRFGDRGGGGGGGGYGDRGRSGFSSRPGIGMGDDSGMSEGGGEPWAAAAPPPPPPPPQVPNYAPPPESAEEKSVIDKMAEFVTRNGPQFEMLMKEKEKNNPKLQFLFAGDTRYDYYKWKVYCLRNNLPSDLPPQKPGMSPHERDEFEAIINNLSGTRESITSGRDWVISHAHIAGDMIDRLYEATRQAHDPEKRLFLIYLINDSLLHSMKARKDPTVLDELSAVFQPKLVHILHLGLENQGSERKEKLLKILNYWEKRGVYDLSVISRMERILQGQEPLPPFPSSASAYPPQIPQQHQAPPQSSLPPWQQPPVYGGGGGGGAPPPSSMPPWQSAPQQPPPPPQQQSSYTHSSPYGPPSGSHHQSSSNMQSRLDEFYNDDDRHSKRHRSSGWDVADDGPNQRRRY